MNRILIALLALCFTLPGRAGEETAFSWPLGPIGGKMRLWTAANYVRISELTPGAPGAAAGLQVNDFITGAFRQDFDALGSDFEGVVRQLGNAIDHAESTDGVLPLRIIRSGTGVITVNVALPVLGALDPAYPLTSAKYAATYEAACAGLHARVMADSDGDLGYPTGWIGLSLLGHPNWNDTTGAKPYRLSVNKLRDWAIARINNGQLTPVEANYYDGTSNPNYAETGLENWSLGQAVMFFAEYVTKSGEEVTHQATLQRAAVMMANRIQNWAQPANGGTADLSYEETRGATGHGGVTGDYTHQWYVGINMAGLYLYNGLALAKRAGADMTQRPKDGHYFGHILNPGDTIPANISPALPASIVLPRGAQDSTSGFPGLDNVTDAPLTRVNNPFFYDCSLDQKFWIQWDCLTRSTDSSGYVAYASVTGAAYDAGGRTPATLSGLKLYHGSTPLPAADQEVADRQMNYIISAHNRHMNAHAYNSGGVLFTAMAMPWFGDRDQRFFLDNWKFAANLSRQPDGSVQFFRGRSVDDSYQDRTLIPLIWAALPRSIARGGLPHVPAFRTDRIMARFRQPLLEWPTPQARSRRIMGNTESFVVDMVDGSGATIPPAQITAAWSVTSGPVTTGILSSVSTLNTTASFPQPGSYRLKLDATDTVTGYTTTENIDITVLPVVPAGYKAGEADYRVYTGITGTTVASLTGAAKYPASPDSSSVVTALEGTWSGSDYGASLTTTIIAPETGTYRFYIASDDDSSLLLNAAGPAAAGAVQIASVSGWTNQYQWNKYGSQQSAVIPLTAGQQYYLQALHKEASGGDHLAVAWTTPSNSTITVIGAPYIARAVVEEPAAITSQPASVSTTIGAAVNFTLTTTGPEPRFYQWRRNGENFGPPSDEPTLAIPNAGARLAGTFDCVCTLGGTSLTSASATLAFTDAGQLVSGGLWQEVYDGYTGSTSVAAFQTDPAYPLYSTSSGVITSPSQSTLGDSYAQVWTGWLIPVVSGRYRFYISGDDVAQLFLSPDAYESHQQPVHSLNSYTSALAWSARSPSGWMDLSAGQRYFVRFVHVEGGGGDHAAFTWQREGDPVPADGSGLIPSGQLQYMTGGVPPDAAVAPPFARADAFSVTAGVPADLNVLANDIDAAPATLQVTSVTQGSNGSVSLLPGNLVRYTPAPGFSGTDTFTCTIRNGLNLTASASVTVTVAPLLAGPVGWWRMNEAAGTTVADSTGSGNSMTLTNGPVWSAAGKFHAGMTFDGTNDHLISSAGKPVPAACTIMAWIQPDTVSGIRTIMNLASARGFRTNGTRLRFTTFGIRDYDTPSGLVSSGVWQHAAVTFVPNTPANGINFYVGGILRHSTDSTGSSSTAGPWRIGINHSSSEAFQGTLDDVRLFDRVLSAAEIAAFATGTYFDDWRYGRFSTAQLAHPDIGAGPLSIPNTAGVTNLAAFAFGLDPFQPQALGTAWSTTDSGGTGFNYRRRKAPHGLVFDEETSGDLQTWSAGVFQTPVITDDGNGLTESVRLVPVNPAHTRLYFRAVPRLAP